MLVILKRRKKLTFETPERELTPKPVKPYKHPEMAERAGFEPDCRLCASGLHDTEEDSP